MRIETIEIHNFKAFQNVKIENIGAMGIFLGENGTGKTSLFDAFGFMKDCLTENVHSALQKRGGYNEVHSRKADGDISILFKYKPKPNHPICAYELQIGLDGNKNPVINRERLSYRRSAGIGKPWDFINFSKGKGQAITNEGTLKEDISSAKREKFSLAASDILAIKSLGQMSRFGAVVEFRKFLEDWFIANFQIDKMRLAQETSYNESLNRGGDNIANVAQYLYDRHKDKFNSILEKMQKRIPGIKKVEAKTTEDGNILLKFHDGRFADPFPAKYVSDGTIKMFAYLVMLANPKPHKLLCIEEPENQLYPHLLEELVEEFREYANLGGQVLISSHSPDLVNTLEPAELFILKKQDNGYSEIKSVSKNKNAVKLYEAGDKLGYLWKQHLL
ncbi:MAG: AAA family ATPase [Fibromonadaceae bacterium]|jgi:predicted ATPase|nr:AAA family ATPase [Fibromonadaceae bacterium]